EKRTRPAEHGGDDHACEPEGASADAAGRGLRRLNRPAGTRRKRVNRRERLPASPTSVGGREIHGAALRASTVLCTRHPGGLSAARNRILIRCTHAGVVPPPADADNRGCVAYPAPFSGARFIVIGRLAVLAIGAGALVAQSQQPHPASGWPCVGTPDP